MKFVSTRNPNTKFSFSEALESGIAPDGGLFVPEKFPLVNFAEFDDQMSFADFGSKLLAPFLKNDIREKRLSSICTAAFNFPVMINWRNGASPILELFHGPTSAFKDIGARFLAECFSQGPAIDQKRFVIVATSGDTGGAVAGAFLAKKNIEVLILYPKNKISARQEKQITAWGENIRAFAVNGSFDDCQRIVKASLTDVEWRREKSFISANSISIGRLLPQMIYYAKSSLEYLRKKKCAPGFVVPTGNLGNAVAALWVKKLGFPVESVMLATNANRPIVDYLTSGNWQSHETISTLANAMDVGNPSNVERLRSLYPQINDLRKDVVAESVSDLEIEELIRSSKDEIFCPHTATALVAEKKQRASNWVVVATAHPAKFESIVEPLIHKTIAVPESLKALLDRPSVFESIEPTFDDFKKAARL